MNLPIIALATLLGALFGSFANVCVYRIPRRESILLPGSHCPHCQHAIAWYDNLPILSWLLLGARCRHCHSTIAWRYPLLELLMALSWGALAAHYGYTPDLLIACILFFLLWILTFIDLETGLLPNAITYPGIATGLLLQLLWGSWQNALIGALAGYVVFWSVAKLFLLATGREGMGYGDFKLLAMLGAFMGWQALPFIVLASSLIGTFAGLIILASSRRGMRSEIPFGPYLAVAGMVWFIWGDAILHWYRQFAPL